MDKRVIFLLVGVIVVVLGVVAAVILIPSAPKKPIVESIPTPITVMFPTSVPTMVAVTTPVPISSVSAIKTFVVEGADYSYSPSIIKVALGSTVVINFKVKTGTHDFKLDEFDVATNQIGEEDEEQVEFVANKKGTFEYYCSVGQHRKNGMVGKLIVE
jgi:plastocyanin